MSDVTAAAVLGGDADEGVSVRLAVTEGPVSFTATLTLAEAAELADAVVAAVDTAWCDLERAGLIPRRSRRDRVDLTRIGTDTDRRAHR